MDTVHFTLTELSAGGKLKAKVLIQTLAPLYHFDFDNPAIEALVCAHLVIGLAGLDPKKGHRMRAYWTNWIVHPHLIAMCVGHFSRPRGQSPSPLPR